MSSPGCLYLQNAVQAVQRISNTRASNIVTSLFWTSVAAAPPFLSHTLSWSDTHKLHGNMPTLPPTSQKNTNMHIPTDLNLTSGFMQTLHYYTAMAVKGEDPYTCHLPWTWLWATWQDSLNIVGHESAHVKPGVLATTCTSHTSSHVHKTNALIVTCSVSAPVRQNYCQHQAVVNKHEKQQMIVLNTKSGHQKRIQRIFHK